MIDETNAFYNHLLSSNLTEEGIDFILTGYNELTYSGQRQFVRFLAERHRRYKMKTRENIKAEVKRMIYGNIAHYLAHALFFVVAAPR